MPVTKSATERATFSRQSNASSVAFINLIAGSAVSWPLVARVQQLERARRIGILKIISLPQ
jgi:hypothetical protein